MNDVIKIIHIITGLNVGGSETMLLKLLTKMDSAKFSNCVISLTTKGPIASDILQRNIPVYSLNMPRGIPSVAGLCKLKKIVDEFNPNIIQCWMYHSNLVGSIINKKISLIWNVRHSLHEFGREKVPTKIVIKLNSLFSMRPNKIIYNSRFVAQQHEDFGFKAMKTIVIPNGFDIDAYDIDKISRNRIRKELSIEDDTIVIGLFGRFHPLKDHSNFLKAIEIISKLPIKIKCILAGTNVDNANIKLQNLIESLSIKKHLLLLGERKDIPNLTNALDIAVLSSSSESFPNVVGEAMACGVPCVVTNVGEAPVIVGDTGIVVPPVNPDALAEGILELIRVGAKKRELLGQNARERIIDNYSLPVVVRKYENLYVELA